MMLSTSAQINEDRNGYARRYDRYSPSSAAAVASDNLIRLPGIPLPLTACCSSIPQGTASGNGSGATGDIVWPVGCARTLAAARPSGRAGKHSVNASGNAGSNRNSLSGGHRVECAESPNIGKGDEPGLSSASANAWSWCRAPLEICYSVNHFSRSPSGQRPLAVRPANHPPLQNNRLTLPSAVQELVASVSHGASTRKRGVCLR